jgi:F0F1-type ATP synthase membrane subunit b/b'
MISLDFTMVLVFLAFLVFVQLLKRQFFDKIAALLQERESTIQQAQTEADSAIARYNEIETTYRATLQEAHLQAKLTVTNAQLTGKKSLESALLSTRQTLESELVTHVVSLQAKKQTLLTQLLEEKQVFLPLIEAQLLPSPTLSKQGASIA